MTRLMLATALALTMILVACNGDDPKQFSTTIDNPYWPMKPLTRWTFHEVDEQGEVTVDTVIVTEATKPMANGVTARVVRDTARIHGHVVEDTFDWYAQAKDGTVWYLGEDTAEFEDGKITSRAGSWEAGKDGARAGIMVPARPRKGMRYREEYSKGNAEDNGEVLSLDEMADVPAGHYDGMVLIKDTSTLETRSLEYKLYAKGAGPVLALGVSGDVDRESLVKMDRAPAGSGQGPLGSP